MSKRINTYVICLVLLIMDCAYSYFTKTVLHGLLTTISLLMFLSFFAIYKERKKLTVGAVAVFLIICVGSIISNRGGLHWLIVSPISSFPILTLFMMKTDDLKNLAYNINKIFYYIILISLILYITHKLIANLPCLEITTYHQYKIRNFFYFYIDVISYEGNFSGFCIEPGYFSPLCICLLVLNKFDLKKKGSLLYVISILLTLSLEGYLLLTIGFLMSVYTKVGQLKKAVLYSVSTFCIVVFFVFGAMYYNDGDNIIAEKILERLVFDEELGIAGNNRENYIVEPIIDSIFYSNAVWWGIGADSFSKAINVTDADACSWRVFVCAYGAIYTIVLFVVSIFGLLKTKIRDTLPLFVIFWLDFYPHGDPFSEILYFMLILFLIYSKKEQDHHKDQIKIVLQRVKNLQYGC